eukprot:2429-Heterococcus_DN1.PRE.7
MHIDTHTNIWLDKKKHIRIGACICRVLTLPPTLLVVCSTAAKYSTSPPSRPLLCSNVRASMKLCDSIKKNDKYTPQTLWSIKAEMHTDCRADKLEEACMSSVVYNTQLLWLSISKQIALMLDVATVCSNCGMQPACTTVQSVAQDATELHKIC